MMSNDLVKMKLELKVLWKFRVGYKKRITSTLIKWIYSGKRKYSLYNFTKCEMRSYK